MYCKAYRYTVVWKSTLYCTYRVLASGLRPVLQREEPDWRFRLRRRVGTNAQDRYRETRGQMFYTSRLKLRVHIHQNNKEKIE